MLNNDNGDQNCLVLLKVQGLRAGCVDQCMHSAKYKKCRTSRIQGVQNKQGKAATTKGNNVKGFESLRCATGKRGYKSLNKQGEPVLQKSQEFWVTSAECLTKLSAKYECPEALQLQR